jgi:hypothetical protein
MAQIVERGRGLNDRPVLVLDRLKAGAFEGARQDAPADIR